MNFDLTQLWHESINWLKHPAMAWQVLALVLCLGLAKVAEYFVRAHADRAGEAGVDPGMAQRLGRGSIKRIAFPAVAALLIVAAQAVLKPIMATPLLGLALPLLGSLAGIRMVFYVLRHSFRASVWLANFERVFALMAWSVVALHLTGLLPDVIDALEAVSFHAGKAKINLWQLLQGLVTVLFTVLLALWLGGSAERHLNQSQLDSNLRVVFGRLAKTLLVVVAVLISLPLVGIDLTTLSVFGGALGVGIGFGMQKIASNYVSGFIILLDRSIRIGNLITVGKDRGEVTRITTRYTVLKDMVGVEALVPNELLVGSVVLNESYSDSRVRAATTVQVAYDTDIEAVMALLVRIAAAQERVLQDPPPGVGLKEFADSGILLELGFWVADPEAGVGGLRSDINLAIWREFKAAGISIPFPQREIRILNQATDPTGSKETLNV